MSKKDRLRIVRDGDPVEPVGPAGSATPAPSPVATEDDLELRPLWLDDPTTAMAKLRRKARRAWRLTGWHAAMTPVYAWRLLKYAAVGAVLGVAVLGEYLNANEYRATVKDAKDVGDSQGVKAERRERRAQRRARLKVVGLVLLGGALTVRLATATWGSIVYVVAGGALLAAAVFAGRAYLAAQERETAVLETPELPPAEDLAPEHLNEAFRASGLLKDGGALTLGFAGIHRDGPGWGCIADMPQGGGKTAADAIAKRNTIAAELGVDEIQLIMDRVRAHEGGHGRRLSIWLADDDPYLLPGKPVNNSPLIGMERFSLWDGPIPFGRDARGRRVEVDIKWESLFFGGLPRRGKTFSQRLIASAGVLDPHVDHYVCDFKGGADWMPIRQVAVRYVAGAEDDALLAFELTLDEIINEMGRRFALLRDLPPSICPQGKLTPKIQQQYRLNWILLTIDELQEALTALDKDDRKRIIDKLCRIARRGPAAGIISCDASQRPDAESVPTKLREIITIRYCTQVVDQTSSDMVLGSRRAAQGADASILQEQHRGVGVLVTGPSNWVTVLADYLDAEAFAEMCLRGRALRETAGTLKGEAAGDIVAAAEAAGRTIPALLNDVLMVMKHSDRMHTNKLLAALDNLDPEAYGDWDPDRLATELATLGVERSGRQVKVDGVNLSGYRRSDIEAAVPAGAWETVPR